MDALSTDAGPRDPMTLEAFQCQDEEVQKRALTLKELLMKHDYKIEPQEKGH